MRRQNVALAVNPAIKAAALTKMAALENLCVVLYTHPGKHIDDQISDLVARNTVKGGFAHASFFYKGNEYAHEGGYSRMFNPLLPEFHEEMEAILEEQKELHQEMDTIKRYFIQVLNTGKSMEDFLLFLPESIHFLFRKAFSTFASSGRTVTDDQANEVLAKNHTTITAIKERMVYNMIS